MCLRYLLFIFITGSIGIASENENNNSIKKQRLQKALQRAMQKEKKYAKEQKFYNADEYDFKGAEIDPESLDDIDTIEPDYDQTNNWGACDND